MSSNTKMEVVGNHQKSPISQSKRNMNTPSSLTQNTFYHHG